MVRFIIKDKYLLKFKPALIYIPIWLDLLWLYNRHYYIRPKHLHSNMVRFIIKYLRQVKIENILFTFQYG